MAEDRKVALIKTGEIKDYCFACKQVALHVTGYYVDYGDFKPCKCCTSCQLVTVGTDIILPN